MLAHECLSEFRMDCELRRLSKRTIKGYYNNCALFLGFLEKKYGITELEDVRPPHLKAYFQYMISRGLSAGYSNGVLKSIRVLFKYAVSEEYIKDNPTARVHWQKEGKVL